MTIRPVDALMWLTVIASLPSVAAAGPDWEEIADGGQDAGNMLPTAQPVFGSGALQTISGSLGGAAFAGGQPGDFQDVYLIRIATPSAFLASTAPSLNGSADFNTQLWLFNLNGLGIIGNDDVNTAGTGSVLRGAATDDSGAEVTDAGLYYLAVSGFDSDPVSVPGPIFFQETATEISGPDGTGGSMPLSGWSANGETGNYVVWLSGAAFVPACSGDLNFDGQVDAADLSILLGSWGSCALCIADLNHNGAVDSADLAMLLGNWGTCP